MGVAEQIAVEVIQMLTQVRLLGAVELLPGGPRRSHVTGQCGHIALDNGESLGRLLQPMPFFNEAVALKLWRNSWLMRLFYLRPETVKIESNSAKKGETGEAIPMAIELGV